MVGVSIVGNIFSEHEVERVMESNAHGTLSVVVIDGNGIEGLKEHQVFIDKSGEIATDLRFKFISAMSIGGIVSQREIYKRQFAHKTSKLGQQPLPITRRYCLISLISVQEVLSMKRHIDYASDRQPHLVPFDGRSDIRRMIMEHNGNEI